MPVFFSHENELDGSIREYLHTYYLDAILLLYNGMPIFSKHLDSFYTGGLFILFRAGLRGRIVRRVHMRVVRGD